MEENKKIEQLIEEREMQKQEQKQNKELVKSEQTDTDIITKDNIVETAILNKARRQESVKEVLDLATTLEAIKQDETIEKLTAEKTEELISDAVAKKLKAETDKIKEEVAKIQQEAEKEVSELTKSKRRLQAEVEELKSKTDKAEAFFNSNKPILRCVGIREAVSLRAMQWLMVPAGFIYAIFQVLLLPLTLLGFLIEIITEIVGAVCGRITKNGLKIVLSIVVVGLILGMIVGIYYLGTTYIFN